MARRHVGDTATMDAPPEEEFSAYLPYIRRQRLAQKEADERRREEAMHAARRVAAFLRARFGAMRVVAFGSLVHPSAFSEHSDIDLAVSGISPRRFFKAWAAAGRACPFELDLVDLRDCSPALRRVVEEEGVEV